MTHLVRLEVSNIKRIKFALVKPDGTTVVVGGQNAAGKSSLIDSIRMLYGGKAESPPMPLRKGTKKGYIEAEESDGTVTRRDFTDKGKNDLTVRKNQNMPEMDAPQAVCDAKNGAISFDPLKFIRMKPPEQYDLMRKMIGVDFDELDAKIKETFDERTIVGREVTKLKARVGSMQTYTGTPDRIDVSAVMAQIEKVEANNRMGIDKRRELNTIVAEYTAAKAKVEELTKQMESLQARGESLQAELADLPAIQDPSSLRKQIETAEEINKRHTANAEAERVQQELTAKEVQHGEMTADINKAKQAKVEMLSQAQYPVAGLSLGEGCVTFNGLPLEQASQAEQLKISALIGFALTPKDGLRVMLIKDASLLDTENRAMFAQMAAEHDTQCWEEIVGNEGDVVIEEGEVVPSAGVPSPQVKETDAASPVPPPPEQKAATTVPAADGDVPWAGDHQETDNAN